ncbi:UbiD family decarboxylase [Rhodoplanes sp. Z2-YC6860]|uniref:UbiD family decarboxylase n=1 Tax=Rhodoplanes sp. Z2-YC6860 TaxID=674703 RepID=UPI00078EF28D|nr:UbiD family decarboxylase [Rhodoplanes sp. Z2-YC6860]AMN41590.1 UbiD-type (de) carboxylyase-like protein [Rhodoplanes sp. Z2-YC6860]
MGNTSDPSRWRDLREWLALIERHGELHRIDTKVDPDEELGAVTFMATRQLGAKALLFEQFSDNPHGARVLANMLGSSQERYALAMGLDPAMRTQDMVAATSRITGRRIAPVKVDKRDAPVNEIVLRGEDIDLTKFPVPTFWPADGGPFIGTGSITLTADATSGRINVGVYRQQLHGPRRVGLNFVPGRHGQLDCQAAWAQGKPAEVVAAFGIDPVLMMVGSQRYAADESELDVAGGIMGAPVELTDGEVVSLPIPARAEMVIEGLVYPGDEEMEGPLGEFHGFYSGKPSRKPVIQVQALHMRRQPIITAALMATYPSCEIGAYQAIMRSARIRDNLAEMKVPGIQGVYCHQPAAAANCLVVVSIKQMYPGHASQALALTAHCPAATYYTKWIVAVDDDVDPTNFDEVMWAMSTRCNPADDLDVLRNTMSFRADPSLAPEVKPFGSKVLVNACTPYQHRASAPVRTALRESMYTQVKNRWKDYRLPGLPPVLEQFYNETKPAAGDAKPRS